MIMLYWGVFSLIDFCKFMKFTEYMRHFHSRMNSDVFYHMFEGMMG